MKHTLTTIPDLLQLAKALGRERAIVKEIDALRAKLRKSDTHQSLHSWGWSEGPDRKDCTLEIPLADYLRIFADKNPVPALISFDYQSEEDHKKGKRQFFEYPMLLLGSINPKFHVWAKSRTESIWADGWVEWNPPVETVEPEVIAA
jgi:hypothetical protein